MRKLWSSSGKIQPNDSTRSKRAGLGFGTTRRVGRPASLMRCKVSPSASLRRESVRAPCSPSSQLTSGITAICSTNWVPLKLECRMSTWNGSTRFS